MRYFQGIMAVCVVAILTISMSCKADAAAADAADAADAAGSLKPNYKVLDDTHVAVAAGGLLSRKAGVSLPASFIFPDKVGNVDVITVGPGFLGSADTTVKHVKFPKAAKSLVTIGANAFEGSNLVSVTFEAESQIATIGVEAFKGSTKLTTVTIDALSELVTIGANAFEGAAALAKFTLPTLPKLASIGASAFKKTVIEELSVNSKVALTLGASALGDMPELTDLTIGDKVVLPAAASVFATNPKMVKIVWNIAAGSAATVLPVTLVTGHGGRGSSTARLQIVVGKTTTLANYTDAAKTLKLLNDESTIVVVKAK